MAIRVLGGEGIITKEGGKFFVIKGGGGGTMLIRGMEHVLKGDSI